MPNNTNQKVQNTEIPNDLSQQARQQIIQLVDEILTRFKSDDPLDAFKILVEIRKGQRDIGDLTISDLPLIEDKHDIKSVYHSLLDEKLITEANDFGNTCKTLGWDKSFHYEFLDADET